MRKLFKYPLVVPLLLIILAILFRVVSEVQGWMPTNGDEAIMNLAALHISQGRDFPAFFYGQHYLGTFEAYIGSVLYRLFGVSVLTMRLEMIGFYVAFPAVIYIFTKRLYNRNFALIVLALLALGSPYIFALQMRAVGYPELPLFSASLFLVAFAIISNDHWAFQRRMLLYSVYGAIAGLSLWVHVLVAPYILTSGSLLILWRFREMLRMGLWCVLVSFLVGALPLLWYNVHASPGQDTLTNILYMTQVGQGAAYDFWQHILNTLFISIPAVTGLSSQCFLEGIAGSYPFLPIYQLHCFVEQASWGLIYVMLILAAMIMAVVGLRKAQYHRSTMILHSTRFMLLFSVVITLIFYVRGSAPYYTAFLGSRYLICLWVSSPAILYPLWVLPHRRFAINLRFFVFTVIFIALAYDAVVSFYQINQAQAENKQIADLAT